MRCQAAPESLLSAQAPTGNINVRLSPFFCADRDFWVSMHEIESVRKGKMDFRSLKSWFDWQVTAGVTSVAVIATNLLGLLIAGVVVLVRWIVRPITRGDGS